MLSGLTIGTLASLASAGIGAYNSSQAGKRARNLIDTQREDNRRWYELEKAGDFSKRADNQAILQKQKELLDAHYKRLAAANAVTGGTDEALALQQQAAAASLAETSSSLAALSAQHKDNVEESYRQTDAALNQQQAQMQMNQANAIAQAAGQGVSAGLGVIGSTLGGADTSPNPSAPDPFTQEATNAAIRAAAANIPSFTLQEDPLKRPQPLK